LNTPATNLSLGKTLAMLLCLGIVVSNFLSMSRWTEDRNVYDDACYLRQAHLFQRFGLDGLDTRLARDDDGYMVGKMRKFPNWDQLRQSKDTPCHTLIPASNKQVLQYPPGTGLVLALFPEGHQVVPLYGVCTILVFGFAVAAILMARSRRELALAAVFGCVALYMMINPTKASYSMAPTMVVCAAAGWLTARLFSAPTRHPLLLTMAIGLLIGLSVNFRLPNLLLSAGYCLYFLVAFLMQRSRKSFMQGLGFGVALLVGMVPTLVANAINAGSPFSTTYGGVDVVAPELDFAVVRSYLVDLQFPLLLIAIGWTALAWRRGRNEIAFVVSANLAANIGFFVTHPLFTPYYTVPAAALSLWTLLYGALMASGPREAVSSPAKPAGRLSLLEGRAPFGFDPNINFAGKSSWPKKDCGMPRFERPYARGRDGINRALRNRMSQTLSRLPKFVSYSSFRAE
jgi:hypothetical protein